ncbi:hypothetical protein HANVADRAFT_52667 [Hanseniaspora valbyensis NRRL Y-1626]|uniref:Mob1/phocein n=1 Tax=Hanseniaspora valbyensis NRRL Y-1626 TaxID=766949 RepID=A0A1B7TDP8_9ASCO|nr:hypothetical protein HANVADRAFT_52667 [Hanseniaspora valbyensis NRRL Y-1626]
MSNFLPTLQQNSSNNFQGDENNLQKTIKPQRGFKWNSKQPQKQQHPAISSLNTPTHNNSSNSSNKDIIDFNYTPSHQLPYLNNRNFNNNSNVPKLAQVSSHKDLKKLVETTLNSDSVLEQAIKLPKGENINEWFAVHTVDFYNHINMLYGCVTEFCSYDTCPKMIATNEYEYLWNINGVPKSVSAPDYVKYLMQWCQKIFDNEKIFPTDSNVPFPSNFEKNYIKPMLKRLFRVYAHIYCHHFNEIYEMNLQVLLNTSFRHFCCFTKYFKLLSNDDYGPLLELVNELS